MIKKEFLFAVQREMKYLSSYLPPYYAKKNK